MDFHSTLSWNTKQIDASHHFREAVKSNSMIVSVDFICCTATPENYICSNMFLMLRFIYLINFKQKTMLDLILESALLYLLFFFLSWFVFYF